ncbi:hypothetical protein ACFL6K_07090 [Candidatus Latescibacterota bacterium]
MKGNVNLFLSFLQMFVGLIALVLLIIHFISFIFIGTILNELFGYMFSNNVFDTHRNIDFFLAIFLPCFPFGIQRIITLKLKEKLRNKVKRSFIVNVLRYLMLIALCYIPMFYVITKHISTPSILNRFMILAQDYISLMQEIVLLGITFFSGIFFFVGIMTTNFCKNVERKVGLFINITGVVFLGFIIALYVIYQIKSGNLSIGETLSRFLPTSIYANFAFAWSALLSIGEPSDIE